MCARLLLPAGAALMAFSSGAHNAAATTNSDWGSLLENRILGGREELGSYQWMASIRRDNDFYKHVCGGTLVAPSFVLTAAHCVAGIGASSGSTVGVGGHSLNDQGEGWSYGEVKEVIVHEAYDSENEANDVALLWLNEPIADKQPVCLNIGPGAGEYETNGTDAILLGWGVTQYDEQLPENQWVAVDGLRSAVLPIIDTADCTRMYANVTRRRVSQKQLCAGLDRGGVDACSGDSGGPLFLWGGLQIGIVSWGYKCGLPDVPSVYTSISAYGAWIQGKVRQCVGTDERMCLLRDFELRNGTRIPPPTISTSSIANLAKTQTLTHTKPGATSTTPLPSTSTNSHVVQLTTHHSPSPSHTSRSASHTPRPTPATTSSAATRTHSAASSPHETVKVAPVKPTPPTVSTKPTQNLASSAGTRAPSAAASGRLLGASSNRTSALATHSTHSTAPTQSHSQTPSQTSLRTSAAAAHTSASEAAPGNTAQPAATTLLPRPTLNPSATEPRLSDVTTNTQQSLIRQQTSTDQTSDASSCPYSVAFIWVTGLVYAFLV